MTNTRTLKGAAAWASAIINGDYSGLDEEETNLLNHWLDNELDASEEIVDVGEPYFSWFYGFHTYSNFAGGDLADYIAVKREVA